MFGAEFGEGGADEAGAAAGVEDAYLVDRLGGGEVLGYGCGREGGCDVVLVGLDEIGVVGGGPFIVEGAEVGEAFGGVGAVEPFDVCGYGFVGGDVGGVVGSDGGHFGSATGFVAGEFGSRKEAW